MGKVRKRVEIWLNNLSLRNKLRGLYIFCVLFPLIVTDGAVLYNFVKKEQSEQQYKMEEQASAVQYNLMSMTENSFIMSKNFYMNDYVHSFLDTEYPNEMSYVVSYQDFIERSLFESSTGLDNTTITMYVDNPTIVNGGVFSRIEGVEDEPWLQEFRKGSSDFRLMFYYDDWNAPIVTPRRKLLFLRKLNNSDNNREKILKIEIDYSSLVNNIVNMNYEFPVYVCKGDKLIFSNEGPNNISQNFNFFTQKDRTGFRKQIVLYEEILDIYIMRNEIGILAAIKENYRMLLLLLFINIILPFMLMQLLEQSITIRMQKLIQTFENVEDDALLKITDIDGMDEVGNLMLHYNRMADRINELIQTVYKDKLKEQEINIARQRAELLALHSQINPHFLFNVLESIRMHSVLRKEYETAHMVEKLAIMERQNVNWTNDMITVKQEMEFVSAYLDLQKYRFGDRLSFELDLDSECENVLIPRLTLVTFTENACVHRIEKKSAPGWIFVRIYKEKGEFCIEVEDTGAGIEEGKMKELLCRMREASLDKLQDNKHVGMINASLRLKMMKGENVEFDMESEEGIGTTMYVRWKEEIFTDILKGNP